MLGMNLEIFILANNSSNSLFTLILFRYKNAAFCYEELLLAWPQNHHYFSRYAEILYTIGNSFSMFDFPTNNEVVMKTSSWQGKTLHILMN